MNEININFYFSRQDDVNYLIRYHSHKCYELVYYFNGFGYFYVNGVKYNYADNSCALIPPNATHNDVHTSDCTIVCIGFSLGEEIPALPVVLSDENGKIGNYVRLISEEFGEKKKDYISVVGALLRCILTEFARSVDGGTVKNAKKDLITQAIEYIDEYYLTDITSEQLSAVSHYSYERFRHLFSSVTGLPPKQYILAKRIEHAKQLLSSTSLSVTEVGSRCGFSTTTQFIKKFADSVGITPYKYFLQMRSETVYSPNQ